jgi:FixJ family two-component response regulator
VRDVTSAGPQISVVDDEASVRTALGRLLRLADYQVTAFASGEDFLASLAMQRPDCAILDIHMPGLTGFEVQAQLCATKSHVPVVFITASDDLALDLKVVAAGGATLLRKPFSNDALLAAVSAALRSKACDAP